MLLAGLVAGVLCASVVAMLTIHFVRSTRSTRSAQHQSDLALVTDCLANVDRVIDLTDKAVRTESPPSAPPVESILPA